MSYTTLKHLEGEMKKCFRCSLCKMVPLPVVADTRYSDCCPANQTFLFHGYSGSGKSIMGLSLLDNRIDVDDDLAEITFSCTACGYCDVACKFIMEAERHQVNMALREYIVEKGKCPENVTRAIETLTDSIRERTNTPPDDSWIRSSGIKKAPEEKAEILVYAGDAVHDKGAFYRLVRFIHVLKKAGVDVGVLGGAEKYSGVLAYWTGHMDLFRKTASDLSTQLNQSHAKSIVVLSGTDFGMLHAKYPEYGIGITPEVLHATEFLYQLVKKGKLKLTRPVHRHVTYHDPCYLGRQSEPPAAWHGEEKISHGCMPYTDPPRPVNRGTNGVYDAPRKLLNAVPGLTFTEMFRIREYAYCCGGGGGAPEAYPEFSKQTAQNRLQEAQDAGAECIVTACYQCVQTLSRHPLDHQSPEILDIIDIVADAAGI